MQFGRLAEQGPLAGYEPKSLIEVRSEHTPINFPSRKNSFDTDFGGLAATVDASQRTDTDLGQLTSPLSIQEREVSANPFNSGSLTHLSVGRPMQNKEQPQQQHLAGTGKLVRSVESFSDCPKVTVGRKTKSRIGECYR